MKSKRKPKRTKRVKGEIDLVLRVITVIVGIVAAIYVVWGYYGKVEEIKKSQLTQMPDVKYSYTISRDLDFEEGFDRCPQIQNDKRNIVTLNQSHIGLKIDPYKEKQ